MMEQFFGLLSGWQENEEKIQVRTIVAINDGMLTPSDFGDGGSHYTTGVIECTKGEGSEELEIRFMHFNSISSGQIILAHKIVGRYYQHERGVRRRR